MEFRKMVMITLYAKQKKRHRCTEQTLILFLVLFPILSSWWVWPDVCHLFFFLRFKITSSWLYWFFLFHNLYFICFLSDLYYILPSAAFKFCLFFCFSNSSRLMLDCLTEISYFLKKTCITMNFLLRTGFPASHRLYIIVFSLSFASRYF